MANYTKFAFLSLNSLRTVCTAGPKPFRVYNQLPACRQMSNLVAPETPTASSSTGAVDAGAGTVAVKAERVSKAMRAYIQRAQEHDEFMKVQEDEYRIGKRHLANMMGEDPDTFTQDDVDRAIEYLFPSGLYDKRARPLMKSPEQVFPQRKAAEFDATGRPHHSFFYTGKANFFKMLFDIVEHINTANDFEDRMIAKHVKPDPALNIDLSGTLWLTKDELQLKLVEEIADIEYDNFVKSMSRLVELPYSYKSKDFIMSYRKPLMAMASTYDTLTPQYAADGRMFVTTYECLRKRSRATVTVRSPGTGLIEINGEDITYFNDLQPKEQVMFPLIFAGMLGKVDVEATVEGGGFSGQSGAIRWGIAMSLRSFVGPEIVDRMRLAGLLQRDYRQRERKKPGQEGARRKFTWKKR